MRFAISIIFLIRQIYSILSSSYFCDLECKRKHIVCKREPCAPLTSCGLKFQQLSLTKEERTLMLHLHNNYRNEFVKRYRRAEFRPHNIKTLSYDEELEFIAQCWANSCLYHKDKCRSSSHYHHVGQNLYHAKQHGPFSRKTALMQAFQYWTKNQINCNVYRHNELNASTSQILWADTEVIGCGFTHFTRRSQDFNMVVCNYGPGCVEREAIFMEGKECFPCNCSPNYKYLCNVNITRKWAPPFAIAASAVEEQGAFVLIIALSGILQV